MRSFASLRALALLGAGMVLAPQAAFAQDNEQDTSASESEGNAILVTGSRIRRQSQADLASPLATIGSEAISDIGAQNIADITQTLTINTGAQNNPDAFTQGGTTGTSNINLRGLGVASTLILLNGRRQTLASAPTNDGINFVDTASLVPLIAVERVEILKDGASSLYGSDAVAGVANAVLRRDFEGFELFASGDYNEFGGGNDFTISGAWGKNTDRGFFGIGAEYDFIEEVTFGDRPYLSGCNANLEVITGNSERRNDLRTNALALANTGGLVGAPTDEPCKSGGFNQRFFEQTGALSFGSAYYTPGVGNILADYSDTLTFGVDADLNQDGLTDVYFPRFSTGEDVTQSLLREQKKFSVMAYGEYTFEGDMNITPFFEALYVNLESNGDSGAAGLFPRVPGSNPFNPCNPNQPNGVDCGPAQDAYYLDPGYVEPFRNYYANVNFDSLRGIGGNPNCFGFGPGPCTPVLFGLAPGGAVGPQPVSAGVSIDGDRTVSETVLEQARFLAGVRADLPWMNVGSLRNWNAEASLLYTQSTGTSDRPGIREDRLALSLGWDPTTDRDGDGVIDGDTIDAPGTLNELSAPCAADELSNPNLAQPDLVAGCVAVNLFTDAALNDVNGQLTQAERAYLFSTRSFETTYEQTLFNAFISGDVFEGPAGPISAAFGVEYRIDEIDSIPDADAAEGLLFGFFSDLGAKGEKWTREAFVETIIPIAANQPLFRELNVEASARWTEDEFYGSAWTYSTKAGWRPFDPLLFKASYGTSFRAPNLRENFINGITGFSGIFDPCSPPGSAISPTPGGGFQYNAAGDTRLNTPEGVETLRRCREEGRNPETVGVDFTSGQQVRTASVEVSRGGVEDIGPETSRSLTMGVAFEQPWFDSFDLNINVNAYDIEIEDTIIEPNGGFLVADCFNRRPGQPRSPNCDRISYGGANGLIDFVEAGFINQDKDTVRGLDYNLTFATEFEALGTPMDFGLNFRANQLQERALVFFDTLNDTQTKEEVDGEFGFPEWTGNVQYTLDFADKHRVTWTTRYIGQVEQDAGDIDLPGSALGTPYLVDRDDENLIRQLERISLADAQAINATGGVDYTRADGTVVSQRDVLEVAFSDTCLGDVTTIDGIDGGDVLCRDKGFADEYFEHTVSYRYQADTWRLIVGIDNVFDQDPPLVDSSEVFAISNVPIGNGYDLDGRQWFFSFRKDFQ